MTNNFALTDHENVLITLWGDKEPPALDRLRHEHPGWEVTYFEVSATDNFVDVLTLGEKVPKELWQKATILVTVFTVPVKIEDAPNLKYIHLFSAGIDHFARHPLFQPSSTHQILTTTSTGIAAPPIAEYITMTLLSLTNRLPLQLTWQRQHKWGTKPPFMTSIGDWVGKTIGIAGYGSIGRHCARILSAMGATVHAYTASARETASSRIDTNYRVPGTGDPDGTIPKKWFSGTSKPSLHAFLSSGLHALIICLPLTPTTKGLFAAEEFNLLQATSPYAPSSAFDSPDEGSRPAGAFVVNIARGAILNQPDLIVALKNRVVRGAALDVTDPEPLPEDSVLWEMDNVIVTPHTSALGSEYGARGFDVLFENLARCKRGEGVVNAVRKGRGY